MHCVANGISERLETEIRAQPKMPSYFAVCAKFVSPREVWHPHTSHAKTLRADDAKRPTRVEFKFPGGTRQYC